MISGNEEARLIFMGVEHTQPEKGRKLVIDIGGGSTELVIGEDFEPQLVESRRMGCVSFANLYFPKGEISRRISAAPGWPPRKSWKRWRGSTVCRAGSMRWARPAVSKRPAKCCWRWAKEKRVTPENLDMLVSEVLKHKSFAALSLPGLSDERKAVFVPGLAILCGVFDALAIRELRLSDGALREGVLYEMEGRFRHQDIRSRTAQSGKSLRHRQRPARRVLETTEQLYSQWLEQNPKLANPQLTALMKWAALLHEVGLTINHSGMQRHSAYILQNSNMPGFNQDQQMLLATLVRFHRKAVKQDEMPRFTLFKRNSSCR